MIKPAFVALAAGVLATPAFAAIEEKGTYLLSLSGIELGEGERVDRFAVETWGVDIVALCRIPTGWRIQAGRSAAPDGRISGRGSHGVTLLNDTSQLQNLTLMRLWGERQKVERRNATGRVPATVAGSFRITGRGERKLTQEMIRLIPATACPAPVFADEAPG